jgi:indole-3-glycerol phosphate synthase
MQIRRRPPNPSIALETLRYQIKAEDSEPKNILEAIIWHKEKEIDQLRERQPLLELRKVVADTPPPKDFLAALKKGKTQPALIAEVKKASPSKGVIRENFNPVAIAQAYREGGASCLSVLTDRQFFQGSFENLALVRQAVDIPLLCKEFIIYPYQIYLARANGADAVLLIACLLTDQDLQYFLKIVKNLGMSALIEVHTLGELDRVLALESVNLIGINNRNLEDFTVDLGITCELLAARGEQIRAKDILIVSESGLHSSEDLQVVVRAGAKAVLIGESLVKQENISQAVLNLFPAL